MVFININNCAYKTLFANPVTYQHVVSEIIGFKNKKMYKYATKQTCDMLRIKLCMQQIDI